MSTANVASFFFLQLKKEQSRCEQLRLENIQNIVEQTRDELTTWWDKCYVLQEDRMRFRPFSEGI